MRTLISILTLIVLTSCLNSSSDSSAVSTKTNTKSSVLDTLISNHRVVFTMEEESLTRGIKNEIHIQISEVEAKDIVICTFASEATARIGKELGYFLVMPELTSEQVTITVNHLENGRLVELGQIKLKTTHNNIAYSSC